MNWNEFTKNNSNKKYFNKMNGLQKERKTLSMRSKRGILALVVPVVVVPRPVPRSNGKY